MYEVSIIDEFSYFEFFLTMENLNTKTIEEKVFDDSRLFDEGFSFMNENKKYECKIALNFYEVDIQGDLYTIICRTHIGRKQMYKIADEIGNIYYIGMEDAHNEIHKFKDDEPVRLTIGRKDLVEADGIVHPYYLLKN